MLEASLSYNVSYCLQQDSKSALQRGAVQQRATNLQAGLSSTGARSPYTAQEAAAHSTAQASPLKTAWQGRAYLHGARLPYPYSSHQVEQEHSSGPTQCLTGYTPRLPQWQPSHPILRRPWEAFSVHLQSKGNKLSLGLLLTH